jgi:hypothetical protein
MDRCTLTISTSYAHSRPSLPHSPVAPSFFPTPSNRLGIAFDSSDRAKETSSPTSVPNTSQSHRGSVTMMGDSLPEEPEACVVNPGNFSSSNSCVLNHRCVIFRGSSSSLPRSPLSLPHTPLHFSRQVPAHFIETNLTKDSQYFQTNFNCCCRCCCKELICESRDH